MRFKTSYIKWVLLAIAGALIYPLQTIYTLNIENWAQDKGLDKAYKKGLGLIMESTPGLVLLACFFILLGAFLTLFVSEKIRSKYVVSIPKITKIKEVIKGKTFRNTTVRLDGFHYQGCVFENITIIYNGGKATLVDCDFNGSKVLKTDVFEIEQYVNMLGNMNLLNVSSYSVKGKEIPSLSDLNENNQP